MVKKNSQSDNQSVILRLLGTKRFLALNLVVFALMGSALVSEWFRGSDLTAQVSVKTAEANEMQDEYIASAAAARVMESGYLAEREARLKLNLQKPGEQVVVIKGLEDKGENEAKDENVVYQPADVKDDSLGSNFGGWWRYFFQ